MPKKKAQKPQYDKLITNRSGYSHIILFSLDLSLVNDDVMDTALSLLEKIFSDKGFIKLNKSCLCAVYSNNDEDAELVSKHVASLLALKLNISPIPVKAFMSSCLHNISKHQIEAMLQ